MSSSKSVGTASRNEPPITGRPFLSPPLDVSWPTLRLNSQLVRNRSEAALAAGSSFSLSCHGNASLRWSSTALRPPSLARGGGELKVWRARPRHTGTYRCAYADRDLEHLHASVHVYVRGEPVSRPLSPFCCRPPP